MTGRFGIRHAAALAAATIAVGAGLAAAEPAVATPAPAPATVDVAPSVVHLAGGATATTFRLPDGEVVTTTTPAASFRPLTATAAQLRAYGFPARPTDPADLADWTRAMSAYRSDAAPSGALTVPATPAASKTFYSNWSGYIAGTLNAQNHTYVAVKSDFTTPTVSNCAGSDNLGAWIGLGGTSSNPNNLVQQGIACGNSAVGSGGSWRPFTEFANSRLPVALCGYKSWTIAHGHVVYQNMSYQSSSKKAFFYLEDETSGVAHSCSASPPSGWTFDGNTAEWITEAPTGTAADFHSVHFTNARTELGSSSSWVTLGSRTHTKTISGSSSSHYCMAPGSIGSDNASFTDSWHQSSC